MAPGCLSLSQQPGCSRSSASRWTGEQDPRPGGESWTSRPAAADWRAQPQDPSEWSGSLSPRVRSGSLKRIFAAGGGPGRLERPIEVDVGLATCSAVIGRRRALKQRVSRRRSLSPGRGCRGRGGGLGVRLQRAHHGVDRGGEGKAEAEYAEERECLRSRDEVATNRCGQSHRRNPATTGDYHRRPARPFRPLRRARDSSRSTSTARSCHGVATVEHLRQSRRGKPQVPRS